MTLAASSAIDTISGLLVLAGLVGACWMFFRGGGRTAISSLQSANQVLEKRVLALEREGIEKDLLIAELQGRTDVTLATRAEIQPLIESSRARELLAESRHQATLRILQMIADRLGSDLETAK